MGQKKRFRIKKRQEYRRRQRLRALRERNIDIGDYFHDGHYIGRRSEK